ncbi:hypothetical protein MAR_028673 [Mya arenaria]|uniref:BZIP domain-containing protein n=1 Tax=Mya arenaria TaxID=6604 RepID=A0ABY7DIT2_MYAAR|nr:uncharacterized protein LOC128225217 [Mya arenaria]XP_052791266.1 uncharacterized protein LOC128225217 [Mya arenaria]XP_052791267.1 uncharacterized protein LOC128225217 [Mya arenaria]WAQ95983.1 hypothetical protein MAR_028673 [Mya arenaria]
MSGSPVSLINNFENDGTPGDIFFESTLNDGIADNVEITDTDDFCEITLSDKDSDNLLFATPVPNFEETDEYTNHLSPEDTDSDDEYTKQEYDLQLIDEIIPDQDETEDYLTPESKSENATWTTGNMPIFSKIDESLESVSPQPSSPLTDVLTGQSPLIYIDDDGDSSRAKRRRHSDDFVSTNIQTALHSKLSKTIQHVQGQSILDEDDDIFGMFGVASFSVQKDSGKVKTHNTSIAPQYTGHEEIHNLEELDLDNSEISSTSIMTPLIKKELQFSIQYKRLTRGEDELVLEPEEPKHYKLTQDEIRRRNLRMEVNRRSAKKSRVRHKHRENKIIKRYEQSKGEHDRLEKVKTDLTARRDQLRLEMKKHTSCFHLKPP